MSGLKYRRDLSAPRRDASSGFRKLKLDQRQRAMTIAVDIIAPACLPKLLGQTAASSAISFLPRAQVGAVQADAAEGPCAAAVRAPREGRVAVRLPAAPAGAPRSWAQPSALRAVLRPGGAAQPSAPPAVDGEAPRWALFPRPAAAPGPALSRAATPPPGRARGPAPRPARSGCGLRVSPLHPAWHRGAWSRRPRARRGSAWQTAHDPWPRPARAEAVPASPRYAAGARRLPAAPSALRSCPRCRR